MVKQRYALVPLSHSVTVLLNDKIKKQFKVLKRKTVGARSLKLFDKKFHHITIHLSDHLICYEKSVRLLQNMTALQEQYPEKTI